MYVHDDLYSIKTVDNISRQWNGRFLRDIFPPDAYLPAFGLLRFTGRLVSGSESGLITHYKYIVIGVDDSGNEIRAELRMDFIQQ